MLKTACKLYVKYSKNMHSHLLLISKLEYSYKVCNKTGIYLNVTKSLLCRADQKLILYSDKVFTFDAFEFTLHFRIFVLETTYFMRKIYSVHILEK